MPPLSVLEPELESESESESDSELQSFPNIEPILFIWVCPKGRMLGMAFELINLLTAAFNALA